MTRDELLPQLEELADSLNMYMQQDKTLYNQGGHRELTRAK